jgi:hypothetical protein
VIVSAPTADEPSLVSEGMRAESSLFRPRFRSPQTTPNPVPKGLQPTNEVLCIYGIRIPQPTEAPRPMCRDSPLFYRPDHRLLSTTAAKIERGQTDKPFAHDRGPAPPAS